jgi:hypothetical protein
LQGIPADRVQLPNVAEGEAAQEGAQRGRRRKLVAQHPVGCSGSEHVCVVDAVSAGQHGVDHGHGLAAHVGSARRIAEIQVALDQLLQPQMLGQGSGEQEPGIGDGVGVIEGDPQTVQSVRR